MNRLLFGRCFISVKENLCYTFTKMRIYNTLTRKIEEFKPLNPLKVGLYTCGPTVYGPGHLGHARTYVNFDLLKRTLFYNGFKVKHILNITDVHDDMIKKANELGITIFELSDKYMALFLQDMKDLNTIAADHYPKVTEHIKEIIEMVKALVDKDFAYVEKDGSVYFRVAKFKGYGQLSGIKLEKAKTGTRVETDKYEKESVADFVLWKGAKKGEPSWDSPWGKGRPGWHIECSVMSKKYLGNTIDIHGGATDLKFPHHENEIAQSEAANGALFVKYWFHPGLLDIESQKMSKSLGNYIEIHEIKEKGFDPLALRYLFLTTHYRQKLNFTWKSLEAAQSALKNLRLQIINYQLSIINSRRSSLSQDKLEKIEDFQKRFVDFINDDLAIPQALALVWEVVKSNIPPGDKLDLILDFDQIFGLKLSEVKKEKIKIPIEVKKLVEEREKMRREKKWDEADKIRKRVEKLGFNLNDVAKETVIYPK